MADKVIMHSTRGVAREIELTLADGDGGCRVTSQVRTRGRAPQNGPCLLVPVSPDVARRWLDGQVARLMRSAGRFQAVPPSAGAPEPPAIVLDAPDALVESLLLRALAKKAP